MTRLRVEFVPAALSEAHDGRKWYAARSQDAADRFMAELDRTIAMIAESPSRWPEYRGGARRLRLRRFPYAALYQVESEVVLVLAICAPPAHAWLLGGAALSQVLDQCRGRRGETWRGRGRLLPLG